MQQVIQSARTLIRRPDSAGADFAHLFETCQVSDRGGREVNQDYCGNLQVGDSFCWALADGLGGHQGGELAARTAVEAVLDSFQRHPELSAVALHCHLLAAQSAVLNLQLETPAMADMRTTLVVLISDSRHALWAHIGDSRLYHFREGRLLHRTKDHSVPQMLADSGDITPDQIRYHPDRNRLLRTIGEHAPIRPASVDGKVLLKPGDALLLCSDGFWEYVLEAEMEDDLKRAATPAEWIAKTTERLLARAPLEHDNYSAVVVFHTGPKPALLELTPARKLILAAICAVLVLAAMVIWMPPVLDELQNRFGAMFSHQKENP
jgi:serine/threonine protein phosphatase PrpC